MKNVKHLLLKVNPRDFQHAFSVWKNTRKNDKPSPNELFLGRQIRIDLPVMPSLLKTSNSADHKPSEPTPAPVNLRPLRPLTVGQEVWIQNDKTKKWDTKAKVKSVSETGRTYHLVTRDGVSVTRNRIFLRPRYT